MNKRVIPRIIKNLDDDVRDDIEKCYLAAVVSKGEFKQKCRRCRDINCKRVIEVISARVSSQHPLPDNAFPWILTKQLIIGALKVMSYTLDEGLAKADRALKNSELSELSELNKLNEPWDLPEVSEECPNIGEVLMDPSQMPHIAHKDIHQLDEDNLIPTYEEENRLHFGSLSVDELSIYTSDDWIKELQAREKDLDKDLPQRCVHINPIGTPKRKAPESDDLPPQSGTPSKRPRRNLEDSFREPRPDGPEEITEPELTDGFPVPPPHGDTDSLAEPIPPDVPSVEHPVPPRELQPSPRSFPRPRVPRPRPRPINIPGATLNRRVNNIKLNTIEIEDCEIDLRKIQVGVSGLLRDLGNIRSHPGIFCLSKELAEQYSNDTRVEERHDIIFDEFLYRAEEVMLNLLESTIRGEPQTNGPHNVPEVSSTREEVTGGIPDHISSQPSVPIQIDEPTVPEHHTPPGAPDETGNEIGPDEEIEFKEPHSRSTTSKTSRSNTTFDDALEVYTPQDGLTRKEFLDKLNAKWEQGKALYNLDMPPPVDFDEVVDLKEKTAHDYMLGLSYAMEAMERGLLTMEQSTPYGIVWLHKC